MRHIIVGRIALLLTLLFAGAAGVFTWVVTPGPSVPPSVRPEPPLRAAATVFEERCGSCHAAADPSLTPGKGGVTKRAEIERFLENHGDAPPEEDQLILDYLAASPP